MAPNRAGRIVFLLIQTLPTFWAEWILILRFSIFSIFWIPHFWISRFPDISNLGTWKSRNLESKKWKKKFSKSKSVLPKMSARSGLVGKKNPPGPIWGHLRPFFPWTEKNPKITKILLIFLGGPMGWNGKPYGDNMTGNANAIGALSSPPMRPTSASKKGIAFAIM